MSIGSIVPRLVGSADNVAVAADDAARTNPFRLTAGVFDDVQVAIARVDESVVRIERMIAEHGDAPLDDAARAATRDARIGAFRVNEEAQNRLKPHFDSGLDAAVTSKMRNADGNLEDAAWQLANKPSPDGRFNGVDLPRALRDSRAAVEILRTLVPA